MSKNKKTKKEMKLARTIRQYKLGLKTPKPKKWAPKKK